MHDSLLRSSASDLVVSDLIGSVAARLRAAGCVFAEDEASLLLAAAADDGADLDRLIARRCAGEPLEHVVGWAAFCGLRLAVGPGVFVPRRRTEFLVARAAALAEAFDPAGVVVDLCCGVAPAAAAVAARLPAARIHAADIDPVQTAFAARNLAPFGDRARVYCGDLYTALPATLRGQVGVIVCNAPYVPTSAIATLPPEARDHEPAASLDGGPDGLSVQRRVASLAPDWLAPGGHLLVETSARQASAGAAAFASAGLTAWVERDEELDATVVIGRRS